MVIIKIIITVLTTESVETGAQREGGAWNSTGAKMINFNFNEIFSLVGIN